MENSSSGTMESECQETEIENSSNEMRGSEISECKESQMKNSSIEIIEESTFTDTKQLPKGTTSILKNRNEDKKPARKQKPIVHHKSTIEDSAKRKKYTRFYANYCSSSNLSNCFCPKTCTDLVTSYLRERICASKSVRVARSRKEPKVPAKKGCKNIPPKRKPTKNVPLSERPARCQPCTCSASMKPCFRSDDVLVRCDPARSSNSSETTASSETTDSSETTVKSLSPSSSKTETSENDDDDQDSDKLDVRSKTDHHQKCCTSSVMFLLYGVFVTYTIGINLAEYMCYRVGLHGWTFFLVPYLLRFLTIGFALMSSDFFFLFSCSYDMPCFVDMLFRIFVFAFLSASCWNMIEYVMETHQVHPLLYFGLSGGLFLVAMYLFFNQCR
uniref:Uncharacterized protein n=1 Tax=Cacopsylla melanoneura TaxID=428564 RepID=A0A8D8TSM1_9HEMI